MQLLKAIFRDEAAAAAFAGAFSRYHALLRSQLAAPVPGIAFAELFLYAKKGLPNGKPFTYSCSF
jgi:hypothetical protein